MLACQIANEFSVSFPGLGIKDILIKRIAFSFELFGNQFSVYWYGIIIAFAFSFCIYFAMRNAPKFGIVSDHIADLFLLVVPLSLIGARIYYVAFSWSQFSGNLKGILDLRVGGLAFYGGVIGGVIAVCIVSRWRKIPLGKLVDYLAPYLPLGQAIGRWGNFFNQEAFGTNTSLPWGMISEGTSEYLQATGVGNPSLPVHPTFLYEFIGNIIIMVVLLYLRKKATFRWMTALAYFGLYGVLRFFVEGIRTDALMIGNSNWRISEVLSAVMVVVSIGLLIWLGLQHKNKQRLLKEINNKERLE